jgi:hypothetical protein
VRTITGEIKYNHTIPEDNANGSMWFGTIAVTASRASPMLSDRHASGGVGGLAAQLKEKLNIINANDSMWCGAHPSIRKRASWLSLASDSNPTGTWSTSQHEG